MSATKNGKKFELQTRRLLLRGARDEDADELFDVLRNDEVMRYWSSPAHKTIADTHEWLHKLTSSEHNGVVEFVVVLRSPLPLPEPPAAEPPVETPPEPLVGSAAERPAPTPAKPASPSTRTTANPNTLASSSPSPAPKPLVIGKCGLWNGQELGFLLHRAHWGRGLASEAVDAVIAHAWRRSTAMTTAATTPMTTTATATATATARSTTSLDKITADVDPRNEASLRLLRRKGFVVERVERGTMETHIGVCDSVYLALGRPVGEKGGGDADDGDGD